MAFIHGKGAATLVNAYDLSAFFNTYDAAATADTAEVSTFGGSSKAYVAGLKDATLSLGGFFDGSAAAVDAVLSAAIGSSTLFTLAPAGAGTIGNRANLAQAYETGYTVSAPVGDAVTVSAEAQVSNGMASGIILADLAARTATGNTTVNDNGASSSAGAVAHLHVTAFTGTDVTIKVQHSADNSTWVDLITFTQLTAIGSERGTAAGTVNRYLRVNIAGTFTSVTFAVALARL